MDQATIQTILEGGILVALAYSASQLHGINNSLKDKTSESGTTTTPPKPNG